MAHSQPPVDPNGAATVSGPLQGLRVLELGSTVAGPFCGRLFADFGADVVKIEPPEGDPLRTMGAHVDGQSLYAASLLRNKSLLSLDLRTEEGRALTHALARKADIIIENFRPGTLERWGLGYEALAQDNPGLIMIRISGFGQDGPYCQRAGYGVIGEAFSGVRHLTGDPDQPPARVGVSMTDYLAGLYGALGAMMALSHRHRTGLGQSIDASLFESAFSMMEPFVPAFDKLGLSPSRQGSRLPGSTPNNLYPCRDGRHIHITAMADAVFQRLATAMAQPELAIDPRFQTATARNANDGLLDTLISDWTRQHDLTDLEPVLQAANVPAARIYTIEDIFQDAHYRARDMLVEAPHDALGSVTLAGIVPKLSRTPGGIRRSGGAIGRDRHRILADWLGQAEHPDASQVPA